MRLLLPTPTITIRRLRVDDLVDLPLDFVQLLLGVESFTFLLVRPVEDVLPVFAAGLVCRLLRLAVKYQANLV